MIVLSVVLCLQISWVYSAPVQLQFTNPYQRILMQQQQLQQQLEELQEMQLMPMEINPQSQPFIIILPNDLPIKAKDRIDHKALEDGDSVVIDAEPQPVEDQKAFLVLPSRRYIIGDIISSIPFLPIEINVPDTISWAYDGIASGISGIISIIGQRLPGPFRRPATEGSGLVDFKSVMSNLRMRNQRPIVIMPIGLQRPVLPVL